MMKRRPKSSPRRRRLHLHRLRPRLPRRLRLRRPRRRPRVPHHLPQVAAVKAMMLKSKKRRSRRKRRRPKKRSNMMPRKLKRKRRRRRMMTLLILIRNLMLSRRPTMTMSTLRWMRPATRFASPCTLLVTSITTCQSLSTTTSAQCPTTGTTPTSLQGRIGPLRSAPPTISSAAIRITSSDH